MPHHQHLAIRRLMSGMKNFRSRHYEDDPGTMRRLVEEGQKPDVLLIGCSDSRVDPALLMQAEPGELFVVRNVANLVPPYGPDQGYHGTSAALEYAVRVLRVRHVVVLGHAHCGGIQGLIRLRAGETLTGDFIAPWVSIASEACDQYVTAAVADAEKQGEDPEERRKAVFHRLTENPFLVERAAVLRSIDNLMTFPCIREKVQAGSLHLHGWWFDLETGDLWALDPVRRVFSPYE